MSYLESIPWIFLQNFVNAVTYTRRSPWLTSKNQPDEIKVYAGYEHLFGSRIFQPASRKNDEILPLVITIHGGGFIMNSPAADDGFARYLADKINCVVVAVDYSKSPRHKFPAAYQDLIRLTQTVIDDTSLHIDRKKVVICARSSGANLALGTAQDSRLRNKLAGLVAITPLVDFVTPLETKMSTRPDPDFPDFLAGMYGKLTGLYVGDPTVSLDDVRLSPCNFEKRTDLPEHIYLIAAEHDLLWKETEDMAEKLAAGSKKQKTKNGWSAGNVEYSMTRGVKHGFENFPEKVPAREAVRLAAVESMLEDVASWIRNVFASS
ncbi:hypothetical protein MRB53_037983 [Persea americana]|nr:hypothetical protein MRB53_037983 [Persea americana]